MSAALKLSPEDEELGEVAAKQFTRPALKLMTEDAAEVAAETAAETVVVEAGIGLLGILGILVAVVAVAVIAYIIYDYFRPHPYPAPRPRPRITPPPKGAKPCPGNPKIPVKPTIEPRPIPLDPNIPADRRKEVRKRKEDRRKKTCNELWDEMETLTNSRHLGRKDGAHGVKHRYFDNICSDRDPSTQEGLEVWNNHRAEFEKWRDNLRDKVEQFQAECLGDLPDGADDWSQTDYPDPSEWRGNDPDCIQYREDQRRWGLGLP